jgi:hypothetical protein
MYLDMDPALASVIEAVREAHAPVDDAINKGAPVYPPSVGSLAGAVGHLLDAIDARFTPPPVQAVKAAA